jgi:hypothetical protein
MPLSDEQIKEIIQKKELQDTEMLEVIQSYLYEKTGDKIYISRPVNYTNAHLMLIAFEKASSYYLNKWK